MMAIVFGLVCFGVVMIYSTTSAQAILANTSPFAYAEKQLLYAVLGAAAFLFCRRWDPRSLQRVAGIGLAASFVALVVVLMPGIGVNVNGARRWISVPAFGQVQPAEFAKIALAVFFAGYLVVRGEAMAITGRRYLGVDLPRLRHLGPILVLWAFSMLVLIFEQDIGTSALFFGLFVSMLYIATQRKSWLMLGFGLFVAGALIASTFIAHVGERFSVWLHPFAAANVNDAYQLVQGLEGMAFGGIFGTGLGQGMPYLTPLVQSDFIMTGFGEELGLTGLMALLLIFGLLVQRGLRAAMAVRDPFSKLLAGGLAFGIALQLFVIVGGVTELIPLTGVTTPFLSQGGSSLVASWMVIALLIRVSDTARRPAPQPIQDEGLTQVVRAA